MESEAKIKIPPLMKKFILDIQANNGLVDITVQQNEPEEEPQFINPVTQAMWLGYKLGNARGRRTEPGWYITGKVTDKGIELSPQPRGNWHPYAAANAIKSCEKRFGGKFVSLFISGPAYAALQRVYEGNPSVQRSESGKHITSIPFFIRKSN